MSDQKPEGLKALGWTTSITIGQRARDTGSDVHKPGGGERPMGTVDEDANADKRSH